jgi:hypothetical protein
MRRFRNRLFIFSIFPILIIVIGIAIPPTPRSKKSFLFTQNTKINLLKNTKDSRIIFIGGSNVGYGLNSKLILDSFNLYPINMGITYNLSLKFILDITLQNIKNGDILVLLPEYLYFHKPLNYGTKELLRMVVDVNKENTGVLSLPQWFNLLEFIPKYSLTKFKFSEYSLKKENEFYSETACNKYGDFFKHWDQSTIAYTDKFTIDGEYNPKVIEYIQEFDKKVRQKGCALIVSFPCIERETYQQDLPKIKVIEKELFSTDIRVIGTSLNYVFDKNQTFDTPYHLLRKGVDLRTKKLIEDLKPLLSKVDIQK